MNEILPSPLVSAAGAVSRPVATTASTNNVISADAVRPVNRVPERLSVKNRDALEEALRTPLESLGEKLTNLLGDNPKNVRLQIDVDEEASRFVYRSINRDTGEIVRQFPSDELLNVIRTIRDIAGLTLDVDV